MLLCTITQFTSTCCPHACIMELLACGENLSHYDLYGVASQIDKAKDSDIADAAADASDKEKNLTGALLECS